MYYGKMTEELKTLYKKYYEKFGVEPDFYEEFEYSDYDYNEYVSDIKKALKSGLSLPELYPPDDDEY